MTIVESASEPFRFFGGQHVAVFAIIAVLSAGLSYILRKSAGRPNETLLRRVTCCSLALVLLGGAVHGEVERVRAGRWSVQESLPLHLCDIGLLVCVAALVGVARHEAATIQKAFAATARRRAGDEPSPAWQYLYELAYVWGVGGTFQAVLTPDLEESFPAPACIRYFTNHGGMIVAVLVLTIGLRMRPLPGAAWRVWLTSLALALVILPLNWLLDANYMYLLGPPARPSLFDYFGVWPWSLLTLAVVATGLIALCCAPFWVLDRVRCGRRGPTPGRVDS